VRMIQDKKWCPGCRDYKPKFEFRTNITRYDGLQTSCIECRKNYNKEHYKKNRKLYKDRAKTRKRESVAWIKKYKKELSCQRCFENHPACLVFHHKDPKSKKGTINRLVRDGYSKEKILKEIEKCEVLCFNCHAKEHFARFYE